MNGLKQWLMSGMAVVLFSVMGYVSTVMWGKIEANDIATQQHLQKDERIQATLQANQEALKEKAIDTNERVKLIDEKLDKLLELKRRDGR